MVGIINVSEAHVVKRGAGTGRERKGEGAGGSGVRVDDGIRK